MTSKSLSHKHVPFEQLKKAAQIGATEINSDESDFLLELVHKEALCDICEKRIAAFDAAVTLYGDDFFEASGEMSADNVVASERASAPKAPLVLFFERATGLIDSAESAFNERAKGIIADWADGLRAVAGFSQVCFTPVAAGARGLSVATAGRGLDDSVVGIDTSDASEGVFEFDIAERQRLFIKIAVSEMTSPDSTYTAVITNCEEGSTLLALDLGLNRKKDSLISEQVELDPGHYCCVILSGKDA